MTRRGAFRGVYCSLFDDRDWQRLTAHARLVLLVLRQCAQSGPAAIFRYYPAVLAEQTGLTVVELEAALQELERPAPRQPWIYRDAESYVVWVRNGLRYDPHLTLANDNHVPAVERAVEALPRRPIVLSFCQYYGLGKPSGWDGDPMPMGSNGSGSAPPPAPPPRKDKDKVKVKEKDNRPSGMVPRSHPPSHPPLSEGRPRRKNDVTTGWKNQPGGLQDLGDHV
jgi:hypothetical protein